MNRPYHCTVHLATWKHGGKKSPGTLFTDNRAFGHLSAEELLASLKQAIMDGYELTIFVDGHRDRRRSVARELYPTNSCPACGLATWRERGNP